MLPISAGVEPATSWSPVGRRIQLSHRGGTGVVSLYMSHIPIRNRCVTYAHSCTYRLQIVTCAYSCTLCHLLVILKVIFANSVDPDQTARSSLIRIHTVCLYAKNRFEKFARIFSRRQKQTTFSDAGFLGALRANTSKANCVYTVYSVHAHFAFWEYSRLLLSWSPRDSLYIKYIEIFVWGCSKHYENTPIQIYRKFHLQKLKIFR